MLDYTKIESRLKSFLKNNKKLGFSVALLVTFLINGDFSYTDEVLKVPVVTRQELQEKIVAEQDNIDQLIKTTERNENEIELKIKKLTQRAEFWVKPLDKSYQLFFIADWGKFSRNRSNTASNFKGAEYSNEVGQENGYGQYANGKYLGMYGIVKNPIEFVDKIDFGANITPKSVPEKTITEKTVNARSIALPTVSVPTINVGTITMSTPATLSLSLPPNPGNPNIDVTPPNAIAALGSINVAAVPAISVNPQIPEIGEAPTVNPVTVSAPSLPGGFTPATIPLPEAPQDPEAPAVKLFDPAKLPFQATGFSQHSSTRIDKGNTTVNNYSNYSTTGGVVKINVSGSSVTTSGGTIVAKEGATTDTLGPSSYSASLNSFFNDTQGRDVVHTGTYEMTRDDNVTAANTLDFVSLNPYSHYATTPRTYDFQGTVDLIGHNNPGSGNVLVGFEHQLLGNNGTSVLKNSGIINLKGGNNVIGIIIDTEGSHGKNETINAGTINITSQNSVGIDYGYYVSNAPKTDLTLGNINVDGTNNYGFRMRYYGDKSGGPTYYDSTNITGGGGTIKVGLNGGTKVIGVSIAQGTSSGDPLSKITNLNIEVGGKNNIGFYRNPDSKAAGHNATTMTLNSTRLSGLKFHSAPATQGSVLVRSDKDEVILDRSFTGTDAISGIGEKNSLMQAGGTGTVVYESGNTATITAPEFYGMTAGNFAANAKDKTTGATAINKGKFEITGDGSVAMAADTGNTINNEGELKVTGKGATGIYNLGTFTQSGATSKLEVSGEKSLGLYNKEGTMTLDGTATISGTKGAIGIFSNGGTVTSNMGSNLEITSDDTGIGKGDTPGLGVYAAKGATVSINGAKIDVKGGSVGIAAVGKNSGGTVKSTITAKNSTISYKGEGYAIYATDGGEINVSSSKIYLDGKATGMEIDKANPSQLVATGAQVYVKSDDVTVFNLSNVTTPISVATLQTDLQTASGVTSITPDSGITKYKLATMDGGPINIDTPISRTDSDPSAGYNYFRRFQVQRGRLNVTKDVTAVMNNVQAADFKNQVVGLEMNSSKKATTNAEAAINLVGAKITADRTDAGDGAVGAFINYGKVSLDSSSSIDVENTETTNVNDKAVGIYAVNGSEVENDGTINVGGNQSIGILGMAYRMDDSKSPAVPVVDEFGAAALGQGKVTIKNTKRIDVSSGNNTTGIYATNNNTSSAVTDHVVENTGTVVVGDTSGTTNTSIGIYADKVTVKPKDGTIEIGEKAVGIYGTNGSVIGVAGDNLGTVKFKGEKGVAISLKGDASHPDAVLKGSKVTLDEDAAVANKEKTGILADLNNDVTLETEVDTGSLNHVTAYYSANKNIDVKANLDLNEDSIGITGDTTNKAINLTYGDGATVYTMNVGKRSTGLFGQRTINLKDKTNIKLNDQKAIGAYAKGGLTGVNTEINADGKLTFTKEESVGLYAENGVTINQGTTSSLDFSAATAKKNIGMYLAGSKWIGNAPVTFDSEHEKGNVYIYAQGLRTPTGDLGSTLTPKALFKVSPNGTASATDRTIGVYLNTELKGAAGSYASNTFDMSNVAAKLEVDKKGIGLYAKNASSSVDNIIKRIDVTSTDKGSVGVYTDGNLKLDAPQGKISAVNQGIGLYGNSGKVTVAGTHNVETTSSGTGVYLTNGSYLTGGKLDVKNNTSGTAAAGVYYTKGSASSQVTHDTDIDVTSGDNALALYADGGIDLKNAKTLTVDAGKDNVGAFVTNASKFTNDGTINVGSSSSSMTNGLGVYVEDGEAVNNSGKNINVTDVTAGSSSVGMAAVAAAGKTAKVTNDGTITAVGDAMAMNVADNSEGVNTGTIVANEVALSPTNILKAIGAYVNGNNAKFTNTGTVKSENIALALQDTKAGKITAGTLELTKNSGVGVYAKDSEVDFDINPTVGTTTGTVGLYATGNTTISGNVSSGANGNGHVGAYVADTNVTFTSTSKVTANDGSASNYGIGIYTAPGYTGTINTTIDQNGDKTIGLFTGNDTKTSTGSDVTFNGTMNVGNGIGVYVPTYSKFTADNTTFNVDGGTAVYLKGGDANLGTLGATTINFGANGGTAIYQNGGTFTAGSNLTINGKGSFLAIKNADSTVNSTVKVGKDGTGINASYDATAGAKDYTLTLGTSGKFELVGDKAAGMSATVTGLGTANKATIVNKGVIETVGASVDTTGIIAKGAYVQNDGKINIGKNGVAIYTTNDGADTDTGLENNGEINLIEDEAKGIVANKADTTKDFILGKISGTKEKLVGAFFKDSQVPVNVKDVNINVGANSKGLVFEGGSNFTVGASSTNNQIKVGDTTDPNNRSIGIAAIGTSGTVSHTDVIAGSKQSMGLYAKNGTLTFDTLTGDLKSTDGNSILTYADGATATIALNGGKTLEIAKNGIGLGVKDGGTITADNDTVIEVKGENGIGAYINNGGNVDSKFKIKVKNAKGRGVYATGTVSSYPEVDELKGDESVGYIFENVTNPVVIANGVQITDATAKKQVGVLAQGTGAGMTLNGGISVVGDNNTGVYSSTGQTVTNNGPLTLGASAGNSSIGIYSKGGAVINNGSSTIGDNSLGIYGEETSVTTNDMTIGDKGVGVYLNNTALGQGDVTVNGNVSVGGNEAIGIQASNAKTYLYGDLSVGAGDSKGIFSGNDGDVETTGDITVGSNSLGIYKNGNAEVKTTVGKTITVADNGYGIFAKGGAKVTNNANVTVGEDSVGIYVDGNNLTSIADVTVADKGVGLLVKNGGTLTSTGLLTVGSNNAVGLYADNSNIIQNGALNIGANDGIGIYSKGSGNISTVGNITVGNDAIGVYKTGKGLVNISSTMNIGDKAYGAYYVGTSKTDSTLNVTGNMTLGKEAVGVYAKNTTVNYNGNITVGETTIGSNGYNNPKVNKNSIGIFGDNSEINYTGNMLVEKPLSVGIYGANGGSITLKSGSTLTAKNGATGIMTGNGVSTITIESGATLNAIGKARDVDPNADTKNATFGISAFSGNIYNYGVINATTGATAIYKDGTAELKNRGTINIDPSSSVLGATPTKANADVGGVNVDISGKTTIGGKLINGGTINIKGDLAMEGMGLDINTGKTVVDARTITGVAYVEPTFSKGNSEQKITVKDVFRIAPSGIGAFSGDVKSKSVSWIAKITKDPTDTTTVTKDITMVKLPYTSLIAGEKYKNLATGLEDIRSKVDRKSESAIFKSLDNIDNHKDFATAVANIRGDIYSNIQERMKTVESAFDRSYDELLSSYNKTKNVDKYSVIYTAGEHEDGTVGVSGYKHKTVGALYVNDREAFIYGGKYGWSAGVVGTDFDFRGDTNKDSKERVISGKLGVHYQTALNRDDDNARLKWLSRGEFTVNRHRTKRHGQIGADTYKHKATFYSTDLSWKNKIYYEYDVNTKWTVSPYAGLDMSYGHIFNIRENGENLGLEVKGKDYFVMTPNVGIETKYVLPVGVIHQLFVKADTRLSYDVVEMYRNPNQAKIREASSGYYDLSEPERRKARIAVGAEIGLEKENTYGLTFRAEYQGYKKSQLNYGVRLNYKF